MPEAPSPVSLSERLKVVRRNLWLVIAIALVSAAVAAGLSLRQTPIYASEAAVSFRDETRDLTLFGGVSQPSDQPAQLAAASAETVTRPQLLRQVKKDLRSPLTVGQLREAVTATADPRSNLVVIEAQAGSARGAAALGNAVASRSANSANQASRRRFGEAAEVLRGRLDALSGDGGADEEESADSTEEQQSSPAVRTTTSALLAEQLSNLESLAAFSSPAQFVERAEVPSEPVSPRPVRNTILGLIFGLIVGLGAAFLRNALDRRLRGTQEIQDELEDLPLLGHVRTQAMGKVAFHSNGHQELDGADLEAFRILRTNLEFLDIDEPPRIVGVTSALPEEGKTTVASSLAFAAAASGKRTVLVECDLRRPTLGERLGLERTPGVSDYLAGQADGLEVIQMAKCSEVPLLRSVQTNGRLADKAPGDEGMDEDNDTDGRTKAPPKRRSRGRRRRRSGPDASDQEAQTNQGQIEPSDGNDAVDHPAPDVNPVDQHSVACISAGSPTERPGELLGSQRLRKLLDQLAEDYELVVLDTSPLLPVADTIELLPLLDGALLCVRMGRTTRDQALAGKAIMDRVPTRLRGLIITGAQAAGDYEYGYYPYAHDYSSSSA